MWPSPIIFLAIFLPPGIVLPPAGDNASGDDRQIRRLQLLDEADQQWDVLTTADLLGFSGATDQEEAFIQADMQDSLLADQNSRSTADRDYPTTDQPFSPADQPRRRCLWPFGGVNTFCLRLNAIRERCPAVMPLISRCLRRFARSAPLRAMDYAFCRLSPWGLPLYFSMETIRQTGVADWLIAKLDQFQEAALREGWNEAMVGLLLGEDGALRWCVRNAGASAASWSVYLSAELTAPEARAVLARVGAHALRSGRAWLCRKELRTPEADQLVQEVVVAPSQQKQMKKKLKLD